MYVRNYYKVLYDVAMIGYLYNSGGMSGVFTTKLVSYTGAEKTTSSFTGLNSNNVALCTVIASPSSSITAAPQAYRLCGLGGNTSACGGLAFGTGTTAATLDDYTLESIISSGITITSYTYYRTNDVNGTKLTMQYTLTNTTSADITINEVGLFGYVNSNYYMYERTVLSEPVTIPAGASNQMVYVLNPLMPPEA